MCALIVVILALIVVILALTVAAASIRQDRENQSGGYQSADLADAVVAQAI
jgi:hypothetical protein